jgi:hypothetical protein
MDSFRRSAPRHRLTVGAGRRRRTKTDGRTAQYLFTGPREVSAGAWYPSWSPCPGSATGRLPCRPSLDDRTRPSETGPCRQTRPGGSVVDKDGGGDGIRGRQVLQDVRGWIRGPESTTEISQGGNRIDAEFLPEGIGALSGNTVPVLHYNSESHKIQDSLTVTETFTPPSGTSPR